MSQSSDWYEERLDEAQEREYALEEKIAKLKEKVDELEIENRRLLEQVRQLDKSAAE